MAVSIKNDYNGNKWCIKTFLVIIVLVVGSFLPIVNLFCAVDYDYGYILEDDPINEKVFIYNYTANAFGWWDYYKVQDIIVGASVQYFADGFGGWILQTPQTPLEDLLDDILSYYSTTNYSSGYNAGVDVGFNNGKIAYAYYYNGVYYTGQQAYEMGDNYQDGYEQGAKDGYESGTYDMNVLSWIKSLGHSLDSFLSIELIPDVLTFGGFLAIPLIFVLVSVIIDKAKK